MLGIVILEISNTFVVVDSVVVVVALEDRKIAVGHLQRSSRRSGRSTKRKKVADSSGTSVASS